jgi:hypothetical protein
MKPHCDWESAIVAPNRRAFLGGLACAAISRSAAQAQSGAASADDVRFMRAWPSMRPAKPIFLSAR